MYVHTCFAIFRQTPEGYGEKLTKCQTAAASKLRRLRVVLLLLKDAVQAFATPHNFKTRPAGPEFNTLAMPMGSDLHN